MSRIANIDIVILVGYLAGMVALGLYAKRFVRNYDDFFVAGRRLGFWLSFGTLTAIFVGGGAIGVAGEGYRFGLGAVWFYWAYALGFLVLALTFLPQLRSLGHYTIADVMMARFGKGARMASSLVTFAAWIFFLAAMIVAGGRVMETVFGLPLVWAILLIAGIFITYTALGGMWAVVITDFVQAALLLTGILALFAVVIVRFGGPEMLLGTLPAASKSFLPEGHGPYIFALLAIIAPTTVVGPDIYLKIWCMKDERTAKRTVWVLILVILIYAVIFALIGAAGRILLPDTSPELVLPSMIRILLRPGLSGLLLVALMAASLSGGVPQMIVCSSILTQDVYRGWINRNASPSQLLGVSRVNTLLVGAAGTALALALPGVVDLTLHAYRIFVPGTVPQVLAAFYMRRVSTKSIIASMVAGPLVSVAGMLFFPWTMKTYFDPVIFGIAVSSVIVLADSALRQKGAPPSGVPLFRRPSESRQENA